MGRAFEYRKARKMKRWSQMARTFTRIGKDIVIAVKAGGPDPETNSKLRATIQNAKAANMPLDNVNRAIKKAISKDTSDYKEGTFEGYAAHGIAVMIETASDNNNRTVANVRSYFNKCDGSLGTSGSVEFMFEHNCFFKVNKEGLDAEEIEFELIDHGAEEVFEEGEMLVVSGKFPNFGSLQSAIENDLKLEIQESGLERIPTVMKKLDTPQQIADVEKLLEKLDEDEDVMNVYHNMEESEESEED